MMGIDGPFFPIFVGVFLVGLALVSHRLYRAAQPLRLQLAEKSEVLLANDKLPGAMREHVEFLLESAFGMRVRLFFSIIFIPAIAVIFVVRHRHIRKVLANFRVADAAMQQDFDEICLLHDRITLANHYILLPLVELEMVLLMPLAILARAVIRGMLSDNDGRKILSLIENKRIRFLTPQRVAASSR